MYSPFLVPRLTRLNGMTALFPLPNLRRPFHHRAEIADGQGEREIQAREHDGREDPPAGYGGYEGESAAGLYALHA